MIGDGGAQYYPLKQNFLNFGQIYELYDFTVKQHLKASSFESVNIYSAVGNQDFFDSYLFYSCKPG